MCKIGQTALNMTHNETLYGTQKQHLTTRKIVALHSRKTSYFYDHRGETSSTLQNPRHH